MVTGGNRDVGDRRDRQLGSDPAITEVDGEAGREPLRSRDYGIDRVDLEARGETLDETRANRVLPALRERPRIRADRHAGHDVADGRRSAG